MSVSVSEVARAFDAYAAAGRRVFPLRPATKLPQIKGWPAAATDNASIHRKWLRKWPDCNIGLATGGGLVAIDIDADKGGVRSFRRLVGRRKLPFTAVAETGSGGFHYLFRVDPGLDIRNGQGLLPGIDVRGERGFIAVEPSIHPLTGRKYRWVTGPEHVADAPKWLVRWLLGRRRTTATVPLRDALAFDRDGDVEQLRRDIIDRFAVSGRGQRNDRMTQAVGSLLGRGYRPELVLRAVTGWWKHFYERGLIGTHPSQAAGDVPACINSMLLSPTFRQSRGVDHRANWRAIVLTAGQRELIDCGILTDSQGIGLPGAVGIHREPSTVVTPVPRLSRKPKERAFVEALVVLATYEQSLGKAGVFEGTGRQLRDIVEDRYGFVLDQQEIDRLNKLYISRPGKPATRYELVLRTRKGWSGTASEFLPTGLLNLMPTESVTGHHWSNADRLPGLVS